MPVRCGERPARCEGTRGAIWGSALQTHNSEMCAHVRQAVNNNKQRTALTLIGKLWSSSRNRALSNKDPLSPLRQQRQHNIKQITNNDVIRKVWRVSQTPTVRRDQMLTQNHSFAIKLRQKKATSVRLQPQYCQKRRNTNTPSRPLLYEITTRNFEWTKTNLSMTRTTAHRQINTTTRSRCNKRQATQITGDTSSNSNRLTCLRFCLFFLLFFLFAFRLCVCSRDRGRKRGESERVFVGCEGREWPRGVFGVTLLVPGGLTHKRRNG